MLIILNNIRITVNDEDKQQKIMDVIAGNDHTIPQPNIDDPNYQAYLQVINKPVIVTSPLYTNKRNND